MDKTKKYQQLTEIVGELKIKAGNDYDNKNYLSASIIYFQLVEGLLRLMIDIFAKRNKVSDDIIDEILDEHSFYKLTIYLDLVKPGNKLSRRLRSLNKKRNDIFHRIFYKFESIEDLSGSLQQFCSAAIFLNGQIQGAIGIPGFKK